LNGLDYLKTKLLLSLPLIAPPFRGRKRREGLNDQGRTYLKDPLRGISFGLNNLP